MQKMENSWYEEDIFYIVLWFAHLMYVAENYKAIKSSELWISLHCTLFFYRYACCQSLKASPNFADDIVQLADRRVNPSIDAITRFRAQWFSETHGTFEDMSVLESFKWIKNKEPQHLTDFVATTGGLCT